MAQRKSLAWTELRVGILVIASFLLLALAIFVIGGDSGLFEPKYTVTAFFPSVNGLREGADVRLEGVTIGNVDEVLISRVAAPGRSVDVVMSLDEEYQNIVRSDSLVTIGTVGLLGDQVVNISRGTEAGAVVMDGGMLQGSEEGDIRRIISGTNDFIANLEVLSEKIVDMADRVDRGEGTLGKFLTDSAIYDNANRAVEEANLLVRDAHTGNGTVGRLISDDQLYQEIRGSVARVDNMLAKIERGEGTLGKFINDPTFHDNLNQTILKVDSMMGRIERGEGTLGKLSRDESLFNDMRATMARVNTLVTSIENGEGTAGRLIKDPALYNTLNQTSSEVLKLLYDFRQDPRKYLTINFRLF